MLLISDRARHPIFFSFFLSTWTQIPHFYIFAEFWGKAEARNLQLLMTDFSDALCKIQDSTALYSQAETKLIYFYFCSQWRALKTLILLNKNLKWIISSLNLIMRQKCILSFMVVPFFVHYTVAPLIGIGPCWHTFITSLWHTAFECFGNKTLKIWRSNQRKWPLGDRFNKPTFTHLSRFFLLLTFYFGHKHHWLPVHLLESRGRAHRRMPHFSCFDSMERDKTGWLLHRGGWFSMADKMKANVHTRRCD